MKKRFFTIAVILCCAVTMLLFSSCKHENDTLYFYEATGNLAYVGEDGSVPAKVLIEFAKAIETIVAPDQGVNEPVDNQVIAVCDSVYESQKATYGNKLHGTVEIFRYDHTSGLPQTSKFIKDYFF